MRLALVSLLSPLVLLGGCATFSAGGHEKGRMADAKMMAQCQMMSGDSGAEKGMMMPDGASSGQQQMKPGQAGMMNCPMMAKTAPAAPPAAGKDEHGH